MYVNVAVLKETQPHERRVALVPSVALKLIKLGAKLHMQSGAGDAIKLTDRAFKDVAFIDDRHALVSDADVVLAVQPPRTGRDQRDEGGRNTHLLRLCEQGASVGTTPARQEDHLLRHGTCSAHHAGAVDGRAVQSVRVGGILRSATRRDTSRPHFAEDNHGCRRDRAGQSTGDGPRRRRSGGDRHRPSSGRCRRGLRRATGNPGTGAVIGRKICRDRRGCARKGRLCA